VVVTPEALNKAAEKALETLVSLLTYGDTGASAAGVRMGAARHILEIRQAAVENWCRYKMTPPAGGEGQ
jgi:hypothetical protein